MAFRFTVILILMHLVCAGRCLCAPANPVEEFPEYEARINWSVGIVKAVGRAAVPGDIENPDQAREIAREQAVIAARRNLSTAVGLVHVTGIVTLAERMTASDAVRSKVEAIVKNAGIVNSRQIYDRSYEVIIQTRIWGADGLASALFDSDIPSTQIPSIMIDIQVGSFQPSMIPEIADTHQRQILINVPNNNIVQPMLCVYYGDRLNPDQKQQQVLLFKATKLTSTDGIILSKRDASRLRALLKEHSR